MGSKKILLADDEPCLLNAIAECLTVAGFLVRGVHDADEVIDSLATWDPDIVISDVEMPGGGARRILQHVNEQRVPAPVLLMTGGEIAWAMQAVDEGRAAALLVKPFFLRRVIEAIQTINGTTIALGRDV